MINCSVISEGLSIKVSQIDGEEEEEIVEKEWRRLEVFPFIITNF